MDPDPYFLANIQRNLGKKVNILQYLISVADPGSGAFMTP
jgi:hypothetical protein